MNRDYIPASFSASIASRSVRLWVMFHDVLDDLALPIGQRRQHHLVHHVRLLVHLERSYTPAIDDAKARL